MSGCLHSRRRIELALDGRLALEERFELEAHLATCSACARLFADLRRLEEAFQRLPEPPLERLDLEAAVAGVRAALDARPRPAQVLPRAPKHRARRSAAVAGLAAAGLAVAIVLFERGSSPAEPATDQSAVLDDVDTAAPTAATPDAPEESAVVADAPQDDGTRLAELRTLLREGLSVCFAGLGPGDAAGEAVARFETWSREAGREWSLRRNVETFADDGDPAVACAALRYLGLRGDVLSRRAIERACDRPELSATAIAALADMGSVGIPGLARCLQEEALWREALARLVAIGGPEAAEVLEREVAHGLLGPGGVSHARQGLATREVLVEGLVALGPVAVDSLLRLVQELPALEEELFYALTLIEGGSGRLVALLDKAPDGARPDAQHERATLVAAVGVLQPSEALPWLAELAADPDGRAAALGVLAAWESAEVLPTLLALFVEGRVPEEEVVAVTRPVLARDAGGVTRFAEATAMEGEVLAAHDLLALLLSCAHSAGGEALAVLALAELLPDDERLWAALAVGELGDALGAERLARGLPALVAADRRLLAACLVTIHAVTGREEAGYVLERLGLAEPARVLLALQDPEPDALRLNHVARELSRRLHPKEAKTRRSTP